MYKTQVARVTLSNLTSKSKFMNTNQMLIHLFPVMQLYALHYDLCNSDVSGGGGKYLSSIFLPKNGLLAT